MPRPRDPRPARGLRVRGLVLLQPLDLVISVLVMGFFVVSAVVGGGDIPRSVGGGLLIMLVMFVVGASIEVIIEALRDLPGLGTVVGFITNGPEMLCLIVGLVGGDIVFAASTPLGSNFMNPVMLLVAASLAASVGVVFRTDPVLTAFTLVSTAAVAAVFFFIPESAYLAWLIGAAALGTVLFWRRPGDPAQHDPTGGIPRWTVLPAAALLVAAGYWLDPVVSFTAEASRAPKGLIGFFVLAALTSWPEFRSCLGLLRRGRTTSAVLNITVSNITNLWLAALGVGVYLATR
ncbi:MAG: sodium:proton exchanger [Candidatus Krumholzibacteriia bacterium]